MRVYYGDGMPATTHVNSSQFADGRFIWTDAASFASNFSFVVDPKNAANVVTPVCINVFTGYQSPAALLPGIVPSADGSMVAFGGQVMNATAQCFSSDGVAALRASSASWAAWLAANGK